MNILVVNDDGITCKGVYILVKHLLKYGNVIVSCPDEERSAASHSILLNKKLNFTKVSFFDLDVDAYKTNGTPADCVRIINKLDCKIDCVISGVNNGRNLRTDIIYSGTVAGAREALLSDIPSIAISTEKNNFDIVEKELDVVLNFIFNRNLLSTKYLLNVNFPSVEFEESTGIRFGRMYVDDKTEFEKSRDDSNIKSDCYLATIGYISIVPIQLDQTDYIALNDLVNSKRN